MKTRSITEKNTKIDCSSNINSHVAFNGVLAIEQGFRRHPLYWQPTLSMQQRNEIIDNNWHINNW